MCSLGRSLRRPPLEDNRGVNAAACRITTPAVGSWLYLPTLQERKRTKKKRRRSQNPNLPRIWILALGFPALALGFRGLRLKLGLQIPTPEIPASIRHCRSTLPFSCFRTTSLRSPPELHRCLLKLASTHRSGWQHTAGATTITPKRA